MIGQIAMGGVGLLGNILGAFGKNERSVSWDKNPLADQYESQMKQAYGNNMGYAQDQANLGSFLDSKRNMTSLNAGMGNLMQAGGQASGAQLRAVGAQNAANKALNYDQTLQAQAQAGQMRTSANNTLTNNTMEATNNYQADIQNNPDFMSRLGMALSGAGGAVSQGMQQGTNIANMLKQFQGGRVG
jgi:hypothetical protein